MALYETGTITSIADLLAHLVTFGAANGWTVDESTVTIAYMTKNGVQLRCSYYSSEGIYISAKVDENTSPSLRMIRFATGTTYKLYSCGNSLYILRDNYRTCFGIMQIETKIGTWEGGVAFGGPKDNSTEDYFLNGNMYDTAASLYKDGAWSSIYYTKTEGELWGSRGSDPLVSNPNRYNMAVVPIPILLAVYAANTNYLHPIGYAPGVFRMGAGNLYSSGDMLTIGGSPYVVNSEMGLLFKLSA